MSTWYHESSLLIVMTEDTSFMFTEGHIRLLIWMCEEQQKVIQEACDVILQTEQQPADALLNAREGVIDLKAWGYRLLEVVEADDDEDDDDDEEIGDTEEPMSAITKDDIKSFREALQERRPLHRNNPKRTGGNLLQKLRRWYLSL